jgi:hypothetical protein
MTLSMSDAVAYGGFSDFDSGIYKRFTEISPVLALIPWMDVQGNSYTYTVEDSLPTASHRPVNGSYASTNGGVNKITEELKIIGVQGQLDRYFVKTQGRQNGAVDMKLALWDGMAQAVSNLFDQDFFEGDDTTDLNSLVGLRNRLTGNQVISVTTNGGPVTLDLLDQLHDAVPFGNKHDFMNRFTRRKINALLRAAGTSIQMIMSPNEVGRQLEGYGDVPFHVVERTGDASSILGFDEQSGSSATTASIYCVAFGDDLVHGIYAGDSPGGLEVQDFGELQTSPQILGRLELYAHWALKHPRCAARLRSITQA